MAHIGRLFPLHWRRDMGLNNTAVWRWPMYLEGVIGCWLTFPNIHLLSMNVHLLSEPDWDGLRLTWTHEPISFDGTTWHVEFWNEWIDGGRVLNTHLGLTSTRDGVVILGDFESAQKIRYDAIDWRWAPGCFLGPHALNDPSMRPFFTGPQSSWQRWKVLYPGRSPWRPPV